MLQPHHEDSGGGREYPYLAITRMRKRFSFADEHIYTCRWYGRHYLPQYECSYMEDEDGVLDVTMKARFFI
jgi:hypothetical protein